MTKQTFLLLALVFFNLNLNAQSLGDINTDVKKAKSKTNELAKYINKIANESDLYAKKNAADELSMIASNVISILKGAHSDAENVWSDVKHKVTQEPGQSLQGSLYEAYSSVEAIERYADRFYNASDNNTRGKNHQYITESHNDLLKALKETREIIDDYIEQITVYDIKEKMESDAIAHQNNTSYADKIMQAKEEDLEDLTQELFDELNTYLSQGENLNALGTIDELLEILPNNVNLYYAQGNQWESLQKEDNAVRSYQFAIRLEPNHFNANYNLGVLYYNKAAKLTEQSSLSTDEKEVSALFQQSMIILKKALPYFEKCYSINKDTDNIQMILSTLYDNLGLTDKKEQLTD